MRVENVLTKSADKSLILHFLLLFCTTSALENGKYHIFGQKLDIKMINFENDIKNPQQNKY